MRGGSAPFDALTHAVTVRGDAVDLGVLRTTVMEFVRRVDSDPHDESCVS